MPNDGMKSNAPTMVCFNVLDHIEDANSAACVARKHGHSRGGAGV